MLRRRVRGRPLIRAAALPAAVNTTAAMRNTQHPEYEFLTQLKQLSALHKIGELTDEEYTAAKQKLLEP